MCRKKANNSKMEEIDSNLPDNKNAYSDIEKSISPNNYSLPIIENPSETKTMVDVNSNINNSAKAVDTKTAETTEKELTKITDNEIKLDVSKIHEVHAFESIKNLQLMEFEDFQKANAKVKKAKPTPMKRTVIPTKSPLSNLMKAKLGVSTPIDINQNQLMNAFPDIKKNTLTFYLGFIKLLLGIIMVILGGLVIAKGASLSVLGAGVWSGLLAAAAGTVGMLWASSSGPQGLTTFLVMSLVSFAISTLAVALTGIGILRDSYRTTEMGFSQAAIWSGGGLVLATFTHCACTLVAVYHTAMTIRMQRARRTLHSRENIEKLRYFISTQLHMNKGQRSPEIPTAMATNEVAKNKCESLPAIPTERKIGSVNSVSNMQRHNMLLANGSYPRSHMIGSDRHSMFGSANSKDKLVSMWLGGQQTPHIQSPIILLPAVSDLGIPAPRINPPRPHVGQLVYPQHPHMPYMIHQKIKRRSRHQDQVQRQIMPANNIPSANMPPEIMRSNTIQDLHRGDRKTSSKRRRNRTRNVDLTYTGLDRAIADDFIKSFAEKQQQTTRCEDVKV